MDLQAEADEIVERYGQGATVKEVAEAVHRSKPFVTKVLKERGVRIVPHWERERPNRLKKDRFLPTVLDLHRQGHYVGEIAARVGVHISTVETWLRSEGLTPRLVRSDPPESTQHRQGLRARGLEMYLQGVPITQVATVLGVPMGTVTSWVHRAGVSQQGGQSLILKRKKEAARELASEGVPLMEIVRATGLSFYVAREVVADKAGTVFGVCAAEGCSVSLTSPNRKYCSNACRARSVPSRPRDPSRYVTFTCEKCGREVTRPRSSSGAFRFCSNQCAARSYNARAHVDDVVLDSGWEALLWGLCRYLKIPIERVDRRVAVDFEGRTYAPDFKIDGVYVEVKGLEDDDDRERYEAWRAQVGPLAVVGREALDQLRRCDTDTEVFAIVQACARSATSV